MSRRTLPKIICENYSMNIKKISFSRKLQWFDPILSSLQYCFLPTPPVPPSAARLPLDATTSPPALTPADQKKSAGLMRVNHAGEICAQALYLGQSLTTTDRNLAQKLQHAAHEEIEHLQWCQYRLSELQSHKSYLTPFWFTGALVIGTFAGLAGDKWSLGFLAETENQVFEHLGHHLEQLPTEDYKSRAIVQCMQQDEKKHADHACYLGAATLPGPLKKLMRASARVMTKIAYFV